MAKSIAFINPRLTSTNVGDIFIEDSVKRILAFDPLTSIDIDPRKPILQEQIDRINQTDAAVIVGTNLWYRCMPRARRWHFTVQDLKKIQVPIIPFGVGTTRHAGDDNGFENETLPQIKIIHDHCAVGSARDWRTVEALNEAGIQNVCMTGCATLFRSLRPNWTLVPPKASRQVVVTVRRGQRRNVRILLAYLRSLGLDPVVAAQQKPDLFPQYPLPFLRRRVPTVFCFDIKDYLQLVERSLGAIGWRLHGNMLHLADGNPAVFFANCSRGESFCSSFQLPCLISPDGQAVSETEIRQMADRLFDRSSFSKLPETYRRYRSEMIRFLEANGLDHHLRSEADASVACA